MDVLHPKLIVIADDYDSAADMLAKLLRWTTPHETVPVRDGQEAIDLARDRRPDAAILDIDMPRLDGITTARELRAMFGASPPLLIACSGQRTREAERSGLFDHVVHKPVDIDQLLGWLAVL